ncbi:dynein light chain 2, cytoplasmic isoform X1 [Dermochelys coriacea]|uniref:dynein light chain 2, cytoplasmic isoform X1 n=1 Tax=Dermochelys coriacea TaxID=27794 RepID=UPI001CA82D04|nr:dynein light chain 2, cytoplasmic isoform X1 [Dermochelys coriacea]
MHRAGGAWRQGEALYPTMQWGRPPAGVGLRRGPEAQRAPPAVSPTSFAWKSDFIIKSLLICSIRHYQKWFTMSDRKAVIKNADMSEDMQQDAVDCATQAMEKYNIEKDIAAYIKKEEGSPGLGYLMVG